MIETLPERRRVFRTCVLKRRYSFSKAARAAARYHQLVYQCRYCGAWHLTSKKGTDVEWTLAAAESKGGGT